ncbi:hypothetical protein B0187_06910 [Haemophilus paracuniculus]|uniref:Epimerase n=1 Tax=Haemophilus paracuniculus TaxID=734 RepID=A0A1T0ARX4_9PAST|nr:DUF1304 domain-containing protein [Haemophilus paracuniculus]OOR98982.1 hypothetical protein B0187_06910 [Haemophilus paracuniculus]
MAILALILTLLVAVEHFYILYLEMFAIESTKAKKIFNLSDDFIAQPKVKVMFANQGLYNGFLAAGLLFGLISQQFSVVIFFLICVMFAGIYGAITANRSIFLKQALPAILAILAQLLA